MGWTRASEMAEAVNNRSLDINQALTYHLQCNHFPPVSRAFIPACIEAIQLVSQGDYDDMIDLPNGRRMAAAEVVKGLHLDAFIEQEEDYECSR